jgi:DNA invertase Pin-like site-specific DNA recombinase
MTDFGYMRVSTVDQNHDVQEDALLKYGIEFHDIYSDKMSGAKIRRPGLDLLLSIVKEGDRIVVWKIDRLGRSILDILQLCEKLEKKGVSVVSLTNNFDLSTPDGRLVFNILCAVAQMERELIAERTREGMAAAKRRGQQIGAKRKYTDEQYRLVYKLRKEGFSYGKIEKKTGMKRNQVIYLSKHTQKLAECPKQRKILEGELPERNSAHMQDIL